MGSRIVGHLRTHVVGYIALVLALSGTAYALERNSVGDRALRANSVGGSELENNAVDSQNLESGAVGARQLQDDCGYLGQITLVGFDFAPAGTLPASGQLLPVNQNTGLWSLYGNTYGGNGQQTFGLPNLSPPIPGTRYVICTTGVFPSRP